ncbi:MAG: low affinity iron permease family protein [Hamadaea sp.]|nr:low affinity iron permease family protein [Hamadaea sp.]NUR47290.1 low affinity iron permease family protein [Hamadaea sp.]NUT08249.1 low affinity iron permease family protein [Hamadaea sp.]
MISDVRSGLARFAGALAGTGSGVAAILAVALVAAWVVRAFTGGFTEHWALVLETVAGAVTLVMVFVIQYATHRQARAILLKLDELIRIHSDARNDVIAVEDAPVVEQERIEQQVRRQATGSTTA